MISLYSITNDQKSQGILQRFGFGVLTKMIEFCHASERIAQECPVLAFQKEK